MATMDGDLYVAPHGEWESYELINHYFQYTDEDEIDDMAFNYADKKLYALDKSNRLYTIDLYSGEMEQGCQYNHCQSQETTLTPIESSPC